MYERIKEKLEEHVEKLLAKEDLTCEEFSLLRFLYTEEKREIEQKESNERFKTIFQGLGM